MKLLKEIKAFTLVELMVVMLLSSMFLIGLTQYTLTGWRLIWREKAVLAALGEARSMHNIMMFGGKFGDSGIIESLRGDLATSEASGIFTFTVDQIHISGNEFETDVTASSGTYTFFKANSDKDAVDFRNHRFYYYATPHLLQYASDNTNPDPDAPDFKVLYSPYVDSTYKRHGYLRGMTVSTGGGTDSDMVTVEVTIDDFENVKNLFQPADPTSGSTDFFKQKYRFVAFGH